MVDRVINITVNSRKAQANVDKLDNSMKGLGRSTDTAQSTMFKLADAAKAVAGALAVQQIIKYADAWTVVNNKLTNSIRLNEDLADVTDRVFNIAQDTRASLDATADLYAKLERSTRDLTLSGDDLAAITTTINQAFIVQGATVQEAETAIRQLGQGLAAGALRGDEFNTVNENGNRLIRALSDSLGVNTARLRELASQNKLTTEIIVAGLREQAGVIEDEYSNTIATFAQNTQIATNNLTKFVGESTTVQGVVGAAGDALVSISENLETFTDIAILAAGVFATRFTPAISAQIGVMATFIATQIKAAQSTTALERSLIAATVTANAGTLAMRGLSTAMALLGGPLGVVALAVSAFIAFGDSADDADESAGQLTKTVNQLATEFRALSAIELAERVNENGQEVSELEALLSDLREEQDRVAESQRELGKPINTSAITESILVVEGDLKKARTEAEALQLALGNVPTSTGGGPQIDTASAGDAQIANQQKVTESLQRELEFRKRFQSVYLDEIFALQEGSFAQQRLLLEANLAQDLFSIESNLEQRRQKIEEDRVKALEDENLTNEQRLLLSLQFDEQLRAQKELAEQEQTEVAQAGADARQAIREAERDAAISTTIDLGNNLINAFQGQSRKLFELGKAAAIAGTVIQTYESATKSFNALAGIPIIGPALGAAAAAAAIAGGIANVNRIKSTSFGGGAGASSSSYSTTGGSAAAPTTGAAPTPTAPTQANQRFVEIRGIEDNQLLTGEQVKGILTESLQGDDDVIIAVSTGQSNAQREGLI